MKMFPILQPLPSRPYPADVPKSVPWEYIAPHEGQAKKNHGGQTLARLADRGGLCPLEFWYVMHDMEYQHGGPGAVLREDAFAYLRNLATAAVGP